MSVPVTNQTPVEVVDGLRTRFTLRQAVLLNGFMVCQGNLILDPLGYRLLDATHLQCLDPASHRTWAHDATVPNTMYLPGHGLPDGTEILLHSTSTLATGLDATLIYTTQATDADHVALVYDDLPIAFSADSTGILTCAIPYAPDPANGLLWYNALTGEPVIDDSLLVGWWTVSMWQTQYASDLTETVVLDVLTDATDAVQAYVSDTAWTQAATAGVLQRTFRRVIGELACVYALRRPGVLKEATLETRKLGDGVKETTRHLAQSVSTLRNADPSIILQQLDAWRRVPVTDPETLTPVVGIAMHSWGTQRWGF